MSEINGRKERKKAPAPLSDHQRLGKRFIPPLMQIGQFEDAEWAPMIVPECLWIALLHTHYGLREGAALSLALARTANDVAAPSPRMLFARASSFLSLTPDQLRAVVDQLAAVGDLDRIRHALVPLVALYPECPLAFLFAGSLPEAEVPGPLLEEIKEALEAVLDRHTESATFVQASVVYIAFVTDKMKAARGTALANFPEIERYPATEQSRRVASSIRGSLNVLFAHEVKEHPSDWPRYFWNRGLELEPCQTTKNQL
jgi:hypothetical protein